MDIDLFLACVKRVSFQTVFITFKKDGVTGLRRLFGLARENIGPEYISTIFAVLQSCDWQRDANRTISTHSLDQLEDHTLVSIARDVEKIECGRHAASAINTTCIKTKTDGAKAIIDSVLNENTLSEATSWGASIEGELVEYDSLPAIEFRIKNSESNELLTKVFVDGWSGRMGRNGEWGDCRYTDPQQLREMIYSAMTDALDAVTA